MASPAVVDASRTDGRLIAIGDIHGHLAALETLLRVLQLRPVDTLVTLGDYVDRGPDSRGVIERLLRLADECRLVPLLGNHDLMFLEICDGQLQKYYDWLSYGGDATLASYGGRVPDGVPASHVGFLRSCHRNYETQRHFFVHASYLPDWPLTEQPDWMLLWESLRIRPPAPHMSGKTAVAGHTAQKHGEILRLPHLICLDTCCYGNGWLTAMDMVSEEVWQADKTGRLRREGRPPDPGAAPRTPPPEGIL